MEVADKRTMGRLSRANVGGMTFDVETEAQLNDPPQVRTYVFLDGRIVDRVIWEFEADDKSSSARMVSLQHESVVRRINTRMVNGLPEDDPRVIGTLPPPEPEPGAPPEEKRLVGSIRPVDEAGVGVPVLGPPVLASPPPPLASSHPALPFRDAVVIDDEATPMVESGAHAGELAELAFLAAGLDALITRHFPLGALEHIAIETPEGMVLVARHAELTAAIRVDRRGSHVRTVADVKKALEQMHEEVP